MLSPGDWTQNFFIRVLISQQKWFLKIEKFFRCYWGLNPESSSPSPSAIPLVHHRTIQRRNMLYIWTLRPAALASNIGSVCCKNFFWLNIHTCVPPLIWVKKTTKKYVPVYPHWYSFIFFIWFSTASAAFGVIL